MCSVKPVKIQRYRNLGRVKRETEGKRGTKTGSNKGRKMGVKVENIRICNTSLTGTVLCLG